MADFIAVIRRAVDGLSDNTPEMRIRVYDRARSAVQRQLDNMKPRPADDVIARQLEKLDEAIASIESEFTGAPLKDLAAPAPAYVEEPAPPPPRRQNLRHSQNPSPNQSPSANRSLSLSLHRAMWRRNPLPLSAILPDARTGACGRWIALSRSRNPPASRNRGPSRYSNPPRKPPFRKPNRSLCREARSSFRRRHHAACLGRGRRRRGNASVFDEPLGQREPSKPIERDWELPVEPVRRETTFGSDTRFDFDPTPAARPAEPVAEPVAEPWTPVSHRQSVP